MAFLSGNAAGAKTLYASGLFPAGYHPRATKTNIVGVARRHMPILSRFPGLRVKPASEYYDNMPVA